MKHIDKKISIEMSVYNWGLMTAAIEMLMETVPFAPDGQEMVEEYLQKLVAAREEAGVCYDQVLDELRTHTLQEKLDEIFRDSQL